MCVGKEGEGIEDWQRHHAAVIIAYLLFLLRGKKIAIYVYTHNMYIHTRIYIYIYIHTYSKTSLNRLITGPTLNGPFRGVVGLGS